MVERFELASELNIYTVMELREALLNWVKERTLVDTGTLKISAKAVQSVDGAGIQLLAALSNMGVEWQLVDVSESFASACRLMGLTRWLDSPYLSAETMGGAA